MTRELIKAIKLRDLNGVRSILSASDDPISVVNATFDEPIEIDMQGGLIPGIKFVNCNFQEIRIVSSNIASLRFHDCDISNSIILENTSISDELQLKLNRSLQLLSISSTLEGPAVIKKIFTNLPNPFATRIFDFKLSHVKLYEFDSSISILKSIDFNRSVFFEGSRPVFNTIANKASLNDCEFHVDVIVNGGGETAEMPVVSNCVFYQDVSFSDTHFGNGLKLIDCDFKKALRFKSCIFKSSVSLQSNFRSLEMTANADKSVRLEISSDLEHEVDFVKLTLDATDPEVKLESLNVKKLLLIQSGASLQFKSLHFNSIIAEDFSLVGATISKEVQVRYSNFQKFYVNGVNFSGAAIFTNNLFNLAPDFVECTFTSSTSFTGNDFKDFSEIAIGKYRELKRYMSAVHHDFEQSLFASLELKARKKLLRIKSDWFELLVSFFYGFINDYGMRIELPFFRIIFLFFIYPFIYWYFGMVHMNLNHDTAGRLTLVISENHFYGAVFLSFLNSLGPLRIFWPSELFILSGLASYLTSFSQMVISSVLWFFLIFGIRKRFRVG